MKKRIITLTLIGATLLSTTTVCAETMFDGETEKRMSQGYYANGFLFTNDGNYWDYQYGNLALNEKVMIAFDTKGTPDKEDDELLPETVSTWGEFRNANGNTYPLTLKAKVVDREKDLVVFEDNNGFEYHHSGCEDWEIGDGASATMNDNGTEYVMDDYIESVRYSGWLLSKIKYWDVRENNWYYDSVLWASENGIMAGYTEDTFAPNEICTRAQAAAIIYRLYGIEMKYDCSFIDVRETDWCYKAIAWANEKGIACGYGEDFGVNDPVTREQFVAMMYRYANYLAPDVVQKMETISVFDDAHKANPYAQTALEWAYGFGIISGKTENILDPQGYITRAEGASIIMRFLAAYNWL